MKRTFEFCFSALIGALLVAATTGCGEDGNDATTPAPIKLGFLSPISDEKPWAEDLAQAIKMAIEEINAAGGVPMGNERHRLELVIIDDRGDAAAGRKGLEKLLVQGIELFIGPTYSGVMLGDAASGTKGVAELAIEKGALLVSPSATNDDITALDDSNLIWRTCPADKDQAKVGATYISDELKAANVAVLLRDDAWGAGLTEVFQKELEAAGGKVLRKVTYDPEEVGAIGNYTPFLDKVFAEPKPDAVYLVTFWEVAEITKDLAAAGYITASYKPIFFGTDGISVDDLLENGELDVFDGMYGTAPGATAKYPYCKKFLDAYQTRFGTPADSYSPYIYDVVYLIALAILEAQSTEPDAVKAALRSVSRDDGDDVKVGPSEFDAAVKAILGGKNINYEGASGAIEFTPQGDPEQAWYQIWQIKGGVQQLVEAREVRP